MGRAIDWFEENIGNPVSEAAPAIGAGALLGGGISSGLGSLFGGAEGALAGGDLAAFDYPALTGAEATQFGAPDFGYTGGVETGGTPMGDPFAGEPSVLGGTDQPAGVPAGAPSAPSAPTGTVDSPVISPAGGGESGGAGLDTAAGAGLSAAGDAAAAASAGSTPLSTSSFGDFGGLGGEDFGAIPGVDNSLGFSPSMSFPGGGGGGGGGGFNLDYGDGMGESASGDAAQEELRRKAREAIAAGGAKPATSPSTIANSLLEKIKANPLLAAGLGLNVFNAASQNKASAGIPGQIKELAKPSATISSDLLAKASTGALSPVAADLTQQAKTGPIAVQAENLIEQSKTGPAAAASNDLLTKYTKGEISPSQAFDIEKWKNQAIAAAKSQYAKAGISDSSAARNAVANIEAKAVAMTDVARQGLLTSGLSALQGSTAIGAQALQAAQVAQNLTNQGLNAEQVNQRLIQMGLSAQQASEAMVINAITMQAKQDEAFAASQSGALNSLMLLQAMSKSPAAAA